MRVKDPAEEEPCGQHTAYEPMCGTCGRIAELRAAGQALLDEASWSLGRPHPENVARLRIALAKKVKR